MGLLFGRDSIAMSFFSDVCGMGMTTVDRDYMKMQVVRLAQSKMSGQRYKGLRVDDDDFEDRLMRKMNDISDQDLQRWFQRLDDM